MHKIYCCTSWVAFDRIYRIYYSQYEVHVIYLWQLLSDVPTHKHCLQVDPKVLDRHPVFYNVSCVGEILNPLLNLAFKWGVVPGG